MYSSIIQGVFNLELDFNSPASRQNINRETYFLNNSEPLNTLNINKKILIKKKKKEK